MDNLNLIKNEISKYEHDSIDAVSIYNNRNEEGVKKNPAISIANGKKYRNSII